MLWCRNAVLELDPILHARKGPHVNITHAARIVLCERYTSLLDNALQTWAKVLESEFIESNRRLEALRLAALRPLERLMNREPSSTFTLIPTML